MRQFYLSYKRNEIFKMADYNNVQTPAVNAFSYPTIKCDNCGCEIFHKGVIFKDIPNIVMGFSEPGSSPVPAAQIYYCAKCCTILKADREQLEKEEEQAKKIEELKSGTTTTASGLII